MPSSPIPLDIPAGVVLSTSAAGARGRYIGSNHIRFRNGRPEKRGGCVRRVEDETTLGIVRGLFSWVTSVGEALEAAGTYVKLYSVSDELQDITPLRSSGTLANDPFAVVDTSTTVTVTHTSHGLDVGAHVHFSGATAGGGITVNGEYTVVSVIDANSYTITHSVAATSTDSTTGGAAVAFQYEINPGFESAATGTGYGVGDYGEEDYGDERSVSVIQEFRYWSFDRYGNLLAALPSGGALYTWDEPASAARAVKVTGSPNARAMFITPERLPFMLGATGGTTISPGPMTIVWPDVDDITDWVPVLGNSANERVLQGGSKLMGGCVYNQVSLIWSDTTLFIAQFLGSFDGEVYDTRPIAHGCGLIGPGAFKVTPYGVFWLSPNGFFLYSGVGVTLVPRFDEIRDYIFGAADRVGHLNRDQAAKSVVGWNPKFNEPIVFYPHDDETEPGHYFSCNADYDYDVGTWARTAISHHAGTDGALIMAGSNGVIYEHEVGVDDDGAALEAYIEHSEIALGNGRTDLDVDGYACDFERQTGSLTLLLRTKDRTMDEDYLDTATFTIAEGDSLVDARLGGRWLSGRLTSNVAGGDFRLGIPMIELGPGGASR